MQSTCMIEVGKATLEVVISGVGDSVVLLAAGGLVPTDPEARRAAHRLRHATLTESERLEIRKAAYLSPVSDARLMEQVQQSPLEAAGDLTETVSQAPPVADWWAGGTAPLLVVQGLDDRRAPPDSGWGLRDQVGDRVRVVDIPQAGHFLVLEQPQAVAEAVTAFLRESRSQRRGKSCRRRPHGGVIPAAQARASDGKQRPLLRCSRCLPRLTRGVRLYCPVGH